VDQAQAFAVLPLAAICADRQFDRQEADLLRRNLRQRTPYSSMEPLAFAELIDGLLSRLRQEPWDGVVLEAAALLTLEQQETALALATQLIVSDAAVTPEECELLERLQDILSLSQERSRQIWEVFEILHRDCLA
jgi:hypothetical protein